MLDASTAQVGPVLVSDWALPVVWSLLIVQRVTELLIARRNAARVRAMGARETGAAHYPAIVCLHVAWLFAWPIEAIVQDGAAWHPGLWTYAMATLALLTQALRYWAIASLGVFWNTRILVVPGAELVARGPYRYLRHPNYVAVIIELSAIPFIFGAWRSALIFGGINLWLLMRVRIPAEQAALAAIAGTKQDP